MVKFSYTTTSDLHYHLKALDDLRREIVLMPLPGKIELRARWEARIKELAAVFSLTGYPFSKRDIVETITSSRPATNERAMIMRLHQSYSHIAREWFAAQKPLTLSIVETLTSLAFPKDTALYRRRLAFQEGAIRQLLDYIDNDKEHSLIRGAISYIEILRIAPFAQDSTILASLLFQLILANSGADARGLLTPEVAWAADRSTYQAITEEASKTGSITGWLTWVAQTSVSTLEQARQGLTNPTLLRDVKAAWFELNDRQKEVLTILEEPHRRLTNKEVQKRFKVSQITASRDLTKLAHLGLLYPRGKGRSVSYTRI